MDDARAGDFVYFDPPYAPLSSTADFTSYATGGFGREDQEDLAKAFAELTRRGVYAMLSSSSADGIRELYAGFAIEGVSAARNVNSNTAGRGKVIKVVVRNYGVRGATAIDSSKARPIRGGK